jgi:hypothetical protein
LRTHAAAVDGGCSSSNSSLSGGSSSRGPRSSSIHTWGGSSSSPGGSSGSRPHAAAAAVPRLSTQGLLAAAATAAAGGGGGPTSPGGLLSPVMQLRFPSCRLQGAVVKMVRVAAGLRYDKNGLTALESVSTATTTQHGCVVLGRGRAVDVHVLHARPVGWLLLSVAACNHLLVGG